MLEDRGEDKARQMLSIAFIESMFADSGPGNAQTKFENDTEYADEVLTDSDDYKSGHAHDASASQQHNRAHVRLPEFKAKIDADEKLNGGEDHENFEDKDSSGKVVNLRLTTCIS